MITKSGKNKKRRVIRIYKDRVGNWRWRITAANGEKVGASSEGFSTRRAARDNLYDVSGLWIASPRWVHGTVTQRYSLLGERSVTISQAVSLGA